MPSSAASSEAATQDERLPTVPAVTTPNTADSPQPGVRRELTGLALLLIGALVLFTVLASVDWRLPVGLLAVAAIGIGTPMTFSKE